MPQADSLSVNPEPRFEISPYLYMQFMEPLGSTEGSVEAAWDHVRDRWRDDLVEATRRLGPPLMRWGGCLSSYYRWKEAVGPRDSRRPMLNLCWGGTESNQVGPAEFVDFCGQVGADPMMVVNFESDGRQYWAKLPNGEIRSAGPDEAAEWVDYHNNPDNPLRRSHGFADHLTIKLWQIGNETSYDEKGFDCLAAANKTVEFARAMRKADPNIELVGWGDSGWAKTMLDVAGEHLQYLAFHHFFGSGLEGSPLNDPDFRRDPDLTWKHLMNAYQSTDSLIRSMKEQTRGSHVMLAITESHFALPGRNRCDVLATWAAGVANARILNVHLRHGDRLKIANLADFCGNRWTNNAIMTPTPSGQSYLMPVAHVTELYSKHVGSHSIDLAASPADLDVTASRAGNTMYLHVVNTNRTRAISPRIAVEGMTVISGRVFQIAAPPEYDVVGLNDVLNPTVHELAGECNWTFPAASVSAVELEVGGSLPGSRPSALSSPPPARRV